MFILANLLVGCDDSGMEFRPEVTDVPAVYDIGELRVLGADERTDAAFDPAGVPDAIHYGRLGASENPGIHGGATFQFRGTGGPVCIVADPEAIFWNRSVSVEEAAGQYKYQDRYEDDGDVDLSVGLTAYYTGSPGVEVGDFAANYTDPAGADHTIQFNECLQVGIFGDTNVHAGRATTEFCEVDTDLHAGILYTVLVETFSLPHDDSILNFGAAVFEGSCNDIAPDECTLPNEVGNADPNGLPESKQWFPDLEESFCRSVARTNSFCEDGFDNEDYGQNTPCIDPDPSDNTTDVDDTGGE